MIILGALGAQGPQGAPWGPKGPRGAPWAPGAPSPLRWVGSKNEPPTENCTFWKYGAPWAPWAPENGALWAPWAPQAPRAPWGVVILATRMIILTTRMIILMLYQRPAQGPGHGSWQGTKYLQVLGHGSCLVLVP